MLAANGPQAMVTNGAHMDQSMCACYFSAPACLTLCYGLGGVEYWLICLWNMFGSTSHTLRGAHVPHVNRMAHRVHMV